MTKDEKFQAIIDRLKEVGESFDPTHISGMIILGYFNKLEELGMISAGRYKVTPRGRSAISICEEFDWKPSDEEIHIFCKGLVGPMDLDVFESILKQFRDNPEKLIADLKKLKDDQNL